MLTEENKKLNFMEKTALLLGVIGITAFSFIPRTDKSTGPTLKEILKTSAFGNKTIHAVPIVKKENPLKIVYHVPLSIARRDTVPKSNVKSKEDDQELNFPNLSSSISDDGKTRTTTVQATDNTGKKYNIRKLNDEITELSVDGKIVPKERYSEYDESLERINEILVRRNLRSTRIGDDEAQRRMEMTGRMRERNKDREFERAAKEQKREMEMKQRMWETKERSEQRHTEFESEMELLEKQKSELFNQRDSLRAFKKFNSSRSMDRMRSKEEIPGIISELKYNKLVDDTENLSFTLNSKELVVNGKKQSAEVHRQFKEKYLDKDGDYFIYKRKGNSISTSINKE